MQFALVHGGWQSGWCWDVVALRYPLVGAGHQVLVPTWLGLPGDPPGNELAATVGRAGTAVADQVLASGLDEVVLVGHSGGGPVIQHVADRLPASVRRLVCVDAWVLRDGESILDVVPFAEQFRAVADARPDRSVEVPPPWWSEQLMNGAPADLVAETATRLVPLPFAHFEHPAFLPRLPTTGIPTSYVFLQDDIAVDPALYRTMAARLDSPRIVECAGPHEAMLTHPRELVAALLEAAA